MKRRAAMYDMMYYVPKDMQTVCLPSLVVVASITPNDSCDLFTHVMQCGSTCIRAIVWVSHYRWSTVYTNKHAHGFVVLCFVVVMQSFIINSHEVFIHIHQGCFAGTGAIVRLPQCQWSKPDGYGKISQCITTTKHSKAVTVCIFLGTYCIIKSLRLSDE